jgi:hypothetical protein
MKHSFKKYTWAANRISEEDMLELYKMKNSEHIPITRLIARAVSEFIKKRQSFLRQHRCLR